MGTFSDGAAPHAGKAVTGFRDTTTRTYEVLAGNLENFPPQGGTFTAWPWGETYWCVEGRGVKIAVITAEAIGAMESRGDIRLTAPQHLVDTQKRRHKEEARGAAERAAKKQPAASVPARAANAA